MDVALRFLLFQQDPGLDRAVVGAAEQGGQGDHIDVIRAALVGVQIALGGRAGGGGGVLALLHGPQQVAPVQGGVVHEGAVLHPDGQRHFHKAGGPSTWSRSGRSSCPQ